jgi:hypothetical protein
MTWNCTLDSNPTGDPRPKKLHGRRWLAGGTHLLTDNLVTLLSIHEEDDGPFMNFLRVLYFYLFLKKETFLDVFLDLSGPKFLPFLVCSY